MSKRDEAVGAVAKALWATGGTDWSEASTDERQYHLDCAENAYDAALAVLHPTVPNELTALDVLPVGSVLRGEDQYGAGWVALRLGENWRMLFSGDVNRSRNTEYLVHDSALDGVAEWTVLWLPKADS